MPTGVAHSQQQFNRRTAEQLNALSRFQGLGVQGGTLPTEVPGVEQFITGQILNEESSSSSSGNGDSSGTSSSPSSSDPSSSSFSYKPDGAGFTDAEGYLAYAFEQTYEADPWKGKVVINGISTTLPTSKTEGANYAYPLNGETWSAGSNVLLKRAGRHWVIIGGAGDGGSLPMELEIDCENGTITIKPPGTTSSSTSSSTSTSSSSSSSSSTSSSSNRPPSTSSSDGLPARDSDSGSGGTSSSVSDEGL